MNGDWVEVCEDSLSFVVELRDKRRKKELLHQVEIRSDEQEGEYLSDRFDPQLLETSSQSSFKGLVFKKWNGESL
ncbi:hypothetical protein Q3G72_022416 [Acer saccharum]|nr:hypothetical protein Q3G72_022416 [Acer saccharum]